MNQYHYSLHIYYNNNINSLYNNCVYAYIIDNLTGKVSNIANRITYLKNINNSDSFIKVLIMKYYAYWIKALYINIIEHY